jgi:membrane-associated phospholipid phosphatase
MGLGFALCTANFFQIILKFFIGGLRPNFYEACRPMTSTGGVGYQNIYYTRSICTNPSRREVSTALLSFPSGHCAAAFAGFGYLALWINAKFKVCADYKSSHWQHALLALPLCVAALLALSKIADYWHHWWDVLAGSLIGMFFAWLSYRQMYWSVFDWQYNHIPLPYPGQLATSTPILVPTRDLTCINWAGWKNKHSDKYMVEKEKELSQVDGAHEEGMGSRHRFDLTHFLV